MEPLSRQQLADLHEALERLQHELRELQDSTAESSRPVDLDQPIGRLSRVDALQQQQMAVASRDAAARRLTQVENALKAIAGGTYGECRLCEEPVGYARLKARPETPFCLNCQADRERKS